MTHKRSLLTIIAVLITASFLAVDADAKGGKKTPTPPPEPTATATPCSGCTAVHIEYLVANTFVEGGKGKSRAFASALIYDSASNPVANVWVDGDFIPACASTTTDTDDTNIEGFADLQSQNTFSCSHRNPCLVTFRVTDVRPPAGYVWDPGQDVLSETGTLCMGVR